MAVLCVIQDSHFVIIDVNPVDNSILQCLLIFTVDDVNSSIVLFVEYGYLAERSLGLCHYI